MYHQNLDPNVKWTNVNRQWMSDHLAKELATLTEFCKHLTAFVNWWGWVKIESDEDGDAQSIILLLDALDQEATIKRWENLQARYKGFIRMVRSAYVVQSHDLISSTSTDQRNGRLGS